jgi:hypothetical protein
MDTAIIDKITSLNMGKVKTLSQSVGRDPYIAATCLLAILCGLAVTRGAKNIDPATIQAGFEKALMVWFVYSVGSGLVLKFPASGRYVDAFREALPPSGVFAATIGLKALIVYLFILLTGKIDIPFSMSAWPIALAVLSVIKLVPLVLVLLLFVLATCLAIGISAVASEVVAHFLQQAVKFDPRKVGRLTKLLKALVGLVTAAYSLWAVLM